MATRPRSPFVAALSRFAVTVAVALVGALDVAPAEGQTFELPPQGAGADSSFAVISDLDASGFGEVTVDDFEPQMPLNPLTSPYEYFEDDRLFRDCDWCSGWGWQLLPDGLIYPSYLAGRREPRFASHIAHESDQGWIWDITLGGRVGLVRYGTFDRIQPKGWQLDIEGAAFPRLDMDEDNDLLAADFRFGVPLSYSAGPLGVKFAYYHLSSHLGDELVLRDMITSRINFSRDVLLFGLQYWILDVLRFYGETGYGVVADEGTDPWEFQFGIDYISGQTIIGTASPFFAINGHLREEVNFGGSVNVETGLAWRGDLNAHVLRAGMSYFNGKSVQFAFVQEHEEQLALAIWYDY